MQLKEEKMTARVRAESLQIWRMSRRPTYSKQKLLQLMDVLLPVTLDTTTSASQTR